MPPGPPGRRPDVPLRRLLLGRGRGVSDEGCGVYIRLATAPPLPGGATAYRAPDRLLAAGVESAAPE